MADIRELEKLALTGPQRTALDAVKADLAGLDRAKVAMQQATAKLAEAQRVMAKAEALEGQIAARERKMKDAEAAAEKRAAELEAMSRRFVTARALKVDDALMLDQGALFILAGSKRAGTVYTADKGALREATPEEIGLACDRIWKFRATMRQARQIAR